MRSHGIDRNVLLIGIEDKVHFVFTRVDPRDHEREFTFVLSTNEDGTLSGAPIK